MFSHKICTVRRILWKILFFTQFLYKITTFLLKICQKSAWYADLPAYSADFGFLTLFYIFSILNLYTISWKFALYAKFCEKPHFLYFFDINSHVFYQKTPKNLRGMQISLRRVQIFKIRQVNIKIIYSIYKHTNKTRF